MNDADDRNLPDIGPDELNPYWDTITESVDYGEGPFDYIDKYDRSGNPISMRDWARLIEFGGIEYKAVKQEDVGPYWVSTVWLGHDHGFRAGGPPIIFETMVFYHGEEDEPNMSDLDCERYSTEEEAMAGHIAMVEKVSLFVALAHDEKAPTHSEE